MRTALFLVVLIAFCATAYSKQTKFAWTRIGKADAHINVPFKVLIKQSPEAVQNLESIFWDVSNPSSKNYQKYLTQDEITKILAPSKERLASVMSWLSSRGVTNCRLMLDALSCAAPVSTVNQAFGLDMTSWTNDRGHNVVRSATPLNHRMSHPDVDFITGLTDFYFDTKFHAVGADPTYHTEDTNVSPILLAKTYNTSHIRDEVRDVEVTQGIAAFGDYFNEADLWSFSEMFGLPTPNITSNTKVIDEGYESSLDTQYITATGPERSVNTFFENPGEEWILDWALNLTSDKIDSQPRVWSISYGWPEEWQCSTVELFPSSCKLFNTTSPEYITRTNTYLMALGANGISVLVSSGDTGSTGFGGYCPSDNSYGYCSLLNLKGCSALTITNLKEYMVIPTSIVSYGMGPTIVALFSNSSCNDPKLKSFCNSEASGGALISEISRLYPDNDCVKAYNVLLSGKFNGSCIQRFLPNSNCYASNCTCDLIPRINYGSCSIRGFYEQDFKISNHSVFLPSWPSSSPYVTSVGATQFAFKTEYSKGVVLPEIVSSIRNKSLITGGGGFSKYQDMPAYQKTAVDGYLSNPSSELPPQGSYDRTKRAYPDVALNGHHYVIVDRGNVLNIDGTSASSPALAGMISLLNAHQKLRGKPTLGFLNPLLYSMAEKAPETFNDITEGDIKCTESYCCKFGFKATKGWDAATGLGTPNIGNILEFLKKTA